MDDDKLEQGQEQEQEPEATPEPEQERYSNDDEIEMLRKIESLMSGLIDKVDALTSMLVEMDSGSVVDEAVEEVAEESIDDALDLDDIDLSL